MEAFAKNVKALIKDRDTTQQKFAESIGVSITTVNGWLKRGVNPLPFNVDAICKEYGVTHDDMYGDTNGLYAKLHGLTDALAGAYAAAEPKNAYGPLYGRVHAGDAGEPVLLDDRIPIPYEVWEHHKNGYFLEVEGTCMDLVYPEGCFVYIDRDMAPQNGSIAVVSINGADFIMRRLHRGASSLLLSPESHDPQWKDIVIDGEETEVKMVGTVVWYQAREEME